MNNWSRWRTIVRRWNDSTKFDCMAVNNRKLFNNVSIYDLFGCLSIVKFNLRKISRRIDWRNELFRIEEWSGSVLIVTRRLEGLSGVNKFSLRWWKSFIDDNSVRLSVRIDQLIDYIRCTVRSSNEHWELKSSAEASKFGDSFKMIV